MKKYLYCPQCKKYPDEIKEEYQEPYRETREWNGEDYELKNINLHLQMKGIISFCADCGEKLEEK